MSEINFDQVKQYILTQATREELDVVVDIYKIRHKNLGVAIGLSFKAGDAVFFYSRKVAGGIVKGKFVRQMNKNAEVLSDAGVTWKVSPQLLNKG